MNICHGVSFEESEAGGVEARAGGAAGGEAADQYDQRSFV